MDSLQATMSDMDEEQVLRVVEHTDGGSSRDALAQKDVLASPRQTSRDDRDNDYFKSMMTSPEGQIAINKMNSGESPEDLMRILARLDLGPDASDAQIEQLVAISSLRTSTWNAHPEGEISYVTSLGRSMTKPNYYRLAKSGKFINERKEGDPFNDSDEDEKHDAVLSKTSLKEIDQQDYSEEDESRLDEIMVPKLLPSFEYPPLNESEKEIRLIRLVRDEDLREPGYRALTFAHRDDLQIRIEQFPLDSCPTFTAISYVWGDASQRASIVCNGCSMSITASLHNALGRTFEWDDRLYLWADGICINQQDILERNSQVKLMGDIYGRAKQSAAYLNEFPVDPGKEGGRDSQYPFAIMSVLTRIWDEDARKAVESRSEEEWSKLQIPDVHELEKWLPFVDLCSQPWATRCWCIQEAVLAKQVLLFYGNAVSSLECLMDFWDHAPRSDLPRALREGPIAEVWARAKNSTQIKLFKRLRDGRDKDRSASDDGFPEGGPLRDPGLLELLTASRSAYATDNRDKVYSLLSMANDKDKFLFPPDYSVENSTTKLYEEVARKFVESGHGIAVLQQAGLLRKIEGLPSWAPDWSTNSHIPLDHSLYRCLKDVPRTAFHFEGGKTLQISGAVVDALVLCCHKVKYAQYTDIPALFQATEMDWIERDPALPEPPSTQYLHELFFFLVSTTVDAFCMLLGARYMTGELMAEAVVRTLVANKSSTAGELLHEEELNILLSFVKRYLKKFMAPGSDEEAENPREAQIDALAHIPDCRDPDEGLFGPDLEPQIWPLVSRVLDANQGRRLVITAAGHIGLVPNEAQRGDLLALVPGSNTPFIIRAAPNASEDVFTLIGECYIHGIMQGELLEGASVEGTNDTSYTVRCRPWASSWTRTSLGAQVKSSAKRYYDPEERSIVGFSPIRIR